MGLTSASSLMGPTSSHGKGEYHMIVYVSRFGIAMMSPAWHAAIGNRGSIKIDHSGADAR
jgi:hypothetical protein